MVHIAFVMMSLVFTAAFVFSWVKFQQYQFLERDYDIVAKNKHLSKLWHLWKGVNTLIWVCLISFIFGFKVGFLNLILYWILFDGLLNIIVLKKGFFYIGTTATIDSIFHKISTWWNTSWVNTLTINKFPLNPIILSATVKLILLIATIKLIF
jgi:hypothetical protein